MHIIHPKYRADIDGLRAIAVLLVVGFHFFPDHIQGGFIGVDIFFVISGYLISTIIFHSLEKDRFSLLEFYNRRVRRILPSLITVLVFCIVCGWFVLFPHEYRQLGKHVAGGAGFISNLLLWRETGYFDVAAHQKPLLHLWSLAIEEQFYIFWPLLLAFIWRFRGSFALVTVFVAICSFVVCLYILGSHPSAAFYLPVCRVWELMMGGGLAFIVLNREKPGLALMEFCSIVGVALLLSGIFVINAESAFPGGLALLPTFGSFLVIYAGPTARLNSAVLSNRFLVGIGLISYPLYLWHWPLLIFAKFVLPNFSAPVRLSVVCVAVLFSWLTYVWIEKPFRFGGHDRLKATILLLALIMVGGTGAFIFWGKGFEYRKSPLVLRPDQRAFDWGEEKEREKSCLDKVAIKNLDYCLMSFNLKPTVAIIGDSHANAIFDALKAEATRKGRGVILLGKGGCPPMLGVERDRSGCPQVLEDIASYLTHHDEITDIIITGRFAATFSGTDFGASTTSKNFYPLKLVDNEAVTNRKQIFETGMSRMLERLMSKSRKVTIALDLPELNFDPASCRYQNANCTIPFTVVTERQKGYTESIMQLKSRYDFNLIDLKDVFCKDSVCTAKAGKKVLYRDRHHLGIYGNEFIESSGFEFLPNDNETR